MKLTVQLLDARERELARQILDLMEEEGYDDHETVEPEQEELDFGGAQEAMPDEPEVAEPETVEPDEPEIVEPLPEVKPEPVKAKVPGKEPKPAPAELNVPTLTEVTDMLRRLAREQKLQRSDVADTLKKYGASAVSALTDEQRTEFFADCKTLAAEVD